MRKIILLVVSFMLALAVKAQVLLNLQIPPIGVFVKSQLWHFSVVNTSSQAMQVKIEMTFTDAANNQRVFTASSRIIQLTQQHTQLQSSDLTPIVYNVTSSRPIGGVIP